MFVTKVFVTMLMKRGNLFLIIGIIEKEGVGRRNATSPERALGP